MKELKRDLLTNKYTKVYYRDSKNDQGTAPSFYAVRTIPKREGGLELECHIFFQDGPINESGVNGIHNEDLLNIVCDRLEHWQKGPFACRENAIALTKIEEALLWLRKRTMNREQRGVEGTNII